MIVNFDAANFRLSYPEFNCIPAYTADTLQSAFNNATAYISNCNVGCYSFLKPAQQTLALNLLTAHLLKISKNITDNEVIGVLTNATVDKVSVTIAPPPSNDQWQYWLNTTPYGQQLLALLQVASVGGKYYGGRPELAAFRRPFGWFGRC